MTREEAKELLPVIQEFAEGKRIEYSDDGEDWLETETPIWNTDFVYRIKPEAKYRPFEDIEECWNEMLKHQPFGYVKSKCEGSYNHYKLITRVTNSTSIAKAPGFFIEFNNNTHCICDMINLFNNYTFADGTPFGIKED